MSQPNEVMFLLNTLGASIHELAEEDSRKSMATRVDAVLRDYTALIEHLNKQVAQ